MARLHLEQFLSDKNKKRPEQVFNIYGSCGSILKEDIQGYESQAYNIFHDTAAYNFMSHSSFNNFDYKDI